MCGSPIIRAGSGDLRCAARAGVFSKVQYRIGRPRESAARVIVISTQNSTSPVARAFCGAHSVRRERDLAPGFGKVMGVVAELDVMGDSLCESGRSKRPALNVRHDHPAAPWAFSGYSRDDMSQVKGRTLS